VASALRGVTPGAAAAMGTFCAVPLVPDAGWSEAAPPPAWVSCDNGWAGAASCAAAATRSYAAADAEAHGALADCLQSLEALSASSSNASAADAPPALFYAADLHTRWARAGAAAAAPAVRRAALNHRIAIGDGGYAGSTVLRCDAPPRRAALQRAPRH
jgi:hypothetical protein